MKVQLTTGLIEVTRIASLKRLNEEVDWFLTNTDHLPDNHRLYLEHNPKNNRKWAETIEPSTIQFVSYILETNAEKQHMYY